MNAFPALTTVFSAPSACATHWTWTSSNNPATVTLWHDYGAGSPGPDVSSCYPHPPGSWQASNNVGTYSPGICPSGQRTVGVWWDATTTTAICCSSGYTYTGEDVGCTRTFDHTTTTVTVEDVKNGKTTTTTSSMVIASGEAVQFAVAVMYQSDDLSLFPSDAQPIMFNAAVPTVTATTSSNGSSSSSSDSSSSSGLSGSTIGVIVVAIILGLSVLFNLALFVMYRRRQSPPPDVAEKRPDSTGFAPLGSPVQSSWRRSETAKTPQPATHELPADQPTRAELHASKDGGVAGYYHTNLSSPYTASHSQDAKFQEISPVEAPSTEHGDTLEMLEREERILAERKARILKQSEQRHM